MQISVANSTLSCCSLHPKLTFMALHVCRRFMSFLFAIFRAAQCLISGSFGGEIKDILPRNGVNAGAKLAFLPAKLLNICFVSVRLKCLNYFPDEPFCKVKKRFISPNWLKRFFNEIIKKIYRSSMFLSAIFLSTVLIILLFSFWKINVLWVFMASCTDRSLHGTQKNVRHAKQAESSAFDVAKWCWVEI